MRLQFHNVNRNTRSLVYVYAADTAVFTHANKTSQFFCKKMLINKVYLHTNYIIMTDKRDN